MCGECGQHFTESYNLTRHHQMCTKEETAVNCPGRMVVTPYSSYEKAFNSFGLVSEDAFQWFEMESEPQKRHIHHAYCGHGGEREIAGASVDGLTKTVYQFHGCCYHGCPKHCHRYNAAELNLKTISRERKIKAAGYNLITMWECDFMKPSGFKKKNRT